MSDVQKQAEEKRQDYPKASAAVLEDTVMDDVLTGSYSQEDLHQTYDQLRPLFEGIDM